MFGMEKVDGPRTRNVWNDLAAVRRDTQKEGVANKFVALGNIKGRPIDEIVKKNWAAQFDIANCKWPALSMDKNRDFWRSSLCNKG